MAVSEQQARIYVPGFIDRKAAARLTRIPVVKEVRTGFALPIADHSVPLRDVWHVEFEKYSMPLGPSPKFFSEQVGTGRLDEVVQMRSHPVGSVSTFSYRRVGAIEIRESNYKNLPADNMIFTTSFPRSETTLRKIRRLEKHAGVFRVYEGQHPVSTNGPLERCDGLVIIAAADGLERLLARIRGCAREPVTITREVQSYSS